MSPNKNFDVLLRNTLRKSNLHLEFNLKTKKIEKYKKIK